MSITLRSAFFPTLDDPAVGEAEQLRGVVGLLPDDDSSGSFSPAVTIARPVRQQEGGIRRVADHAAVGAAVGQSEYTGRGGSSSRGSRRGCPRSS